MGKGNSVMKRGECKVRELFFLDVLDVPVDKEKRRKVRKEFHREKWVDGCLKRQNDRCFYCGEFITKANCHVDHVLPVYRGGENTYGNLVAACKDCNWAKSADCLEITNEETIEFYQKLRKEFGKRYNRIQRGKIGKNEKRIMGRYKKWGAKRFRKINVEVIFK